MVDLDPQACLTYSLGFDPDALDRSLHDVFVRRAERGRSRPARCPAWPASTCCPATIDLAGSEVHLLTRTGREHVLERALEPVLDRLRPDPDRLPARRSGVLTINGLTAADAVLIPLQCEALSHRGVGQLLETIEDVRAFANSDLSVRGIIATMYDDRTRHARHIIEEVEARYGIPVLPAAGAQVDPIRRGPGPGEVHPPARPELAGGRTPTASWPAPCSTRAWSPAPSASGRPGPDPWASGRSTGCPWTRRPSKGRYGTAPGPDGRRPTPSSWRPDRRHARPAGKHALFSAATPAGERGRRRRSTAADPLPPRGLFTVACSSCGSVTRVGLLDFLWLQFPFGPGCPGGSFDRWMTCPACRRRTWTSVTLTR